MPLSTITAASASSHSTHRAAPQPFYGRQTAVSPCVEGAPRWSPTPTRASASSAADRDRRAINALNRRRAAAAEHGLVGHARGSSSASPPRGTARTRRRCCAHRRRAIPRSCRTDRGGHRAVSDVKDTTRGSPRCAGSGCRAHGRGPMERHGIGKKDLPSRSVWGYTPRGGPLARGGRV